MLFNCYFTLIDKLFVSVLFILGYNDQVLFLELRTLNKLAEDNVFESDWLMELLSELIEAIFVWISNNKQIWTTTEEDLISQDSDVYNQVYILYLLVGESLKINIFRLVSKMLSVVHSYIYVQSYSNLNFFGPLIC